MNDYRNQHNARSPPQEQADRKTPFYTVSFSSIIFSIDGKKQSTRGMGSVAPHVLRTTT